MFQFLINIAQRRTSTPAASELDVSNKKHTPSRPIIHPRKHARSEAVSSPLTAVVLTSDPASGSDSRKFKKRKLDDSPSSPEYKTPSPSSVIDYFYDGMESQDQNIELAPQTWNAINRPLPLLEDASPSSPLSCARDLPVSFFLPEDMPGDFSMADFLVSSPATPNIPIPSSPLVGAVPLEVAQIEAVVLPFSTAQSGRDEDAVSSVSAVLSPAGSGQEGSEGGSMSVPQVVTASILTPLADQERKLDLNGKQNQSNSLLSELPVLRDIALRPGIVLKLSSAIPVDATHGYMRGKVSDNQCTYCKSGHGPMQQCVVVSEADGIRTFFKGSCTNCHYGKNGVRCSFRENTANTKTSVLNMKLSRQQAKNLKKQSGRTSRKNDPDADRIAILVAMSEDDFLREEAQLAVFAMQIKTAQSNRLQRLVENLPKTLPVMIPARMRRSDPPPRRVPLREPHSVKSSPYPYDGFVPVAEEPVAEHIV